MKVLLASIDSKYIHSNLAVRSLKKYAEQKLRESGAFCDIEIAEYTINQQPAKVMADIYKHDADVIMFSCYIWNRAFMEKLLSDLAAVRPDVDIWLGGPEVSFDNEEILVRFSNVRGIMTGEGEETFAKLLSAYAAADEVTDYSVDDFNSISGIIYRSSAEAIVCTPQREPLDMDQLPFVYEDLSDFENRIIYYESSRGCPFRCSYCLSSVDKKLRFRSLDQVKKELKFFLDNNVRQVKFVDRTFNCDYDRTMEIWRFIRDNDNGITNFHFEMAADILKEADGLVIGSPVYYASANATLMALMQRLFYSTSYSKAMKVGCSVVAARRGGLSSTYDEMNKFFGISGMPIAPSQYWPMVHGNTPDQVRQDEEGMQIMRTLGRNIAFMIKAFALAKENGINPPELEKEKKFTNFIR